MKRTLLGVLIAVGLASVPAFSDQIFVCQSCTTPPGGDPNFIANASSFDVGLAGKGHSTQSAVIVIVGVYDGTGATTAPTLRLGTTAYAPGGLGDWGETADMVAMTSGDAYNVVGFNDINGGHSETFANWNLGEAKAGIAAATSFELFAYDVNAALQGNSSVAMSLSSVPQGTFVIAFSCSPKGADSESGNPCLHGDIASTPFTNAGLITTHGVIVPEPGTMALIGTGLLSASFARRKRIRRPNL